ARPYAAGIHGNRPQALGAGGRLSGAVAELKDAGSMLPRDPSIRRNLGILLSQAGARDEAEKELRQSLELDPRSAGTRQELARVCAREGRTAEAEREYLAALQLAPAASLHHELGELYSNQRLLDRAV